MLMTATMTGTRRAPWATVAPVMDVLGLSYRQLDYWARQGYIDIYGTHRGSGSRRSFTPEDIDRLAVLAAVGDALGVGFDGTLITAVWQAFKHVPPRHWSTVYLHNDEGTWRIRDTFDRTIAPCAIILDVPTALIPIDRWEEATR